MRKINTQKINTQAGTAHTHTHKPRKDNIERATQIHKKAAIKFNSPNIKSNFLNDTHKFKYKLLFYLAAIAIL